MIEKKTVIDQTEITRSGCIQIRFGLLLIEDGKEIDCKWHRTIVEPGGNVDAQIAAVNAHLQLMGKAAVDAAEVGLVRSVAGLVHTPEVVQKFKAEKLRASGQDER